MSATTQERAPARRTVDITGHPGAVRRPPRSPRLVELERRRPPRPARERLGLGSHPDKLAAWAFLLGLLLVLVALTA